MIFQKYLLCCKLQVWLCQIMYIVNIIFLLLFVRVSVFGQQRVEHEFVGTLQINGGGLVTYKLVFSEMGGLTIAGTSMTDLLGPDKTSSKIEGALSVDKTKISIRETENIYTKSTAADSLFCYIHINNARIKRVSNKRVIQGNFVGKYRNGKKCVDGYVYLIGADFADSLAQKAALSANENTSDTLKRLLSTYSQKVKGSGITELKKNELLSIKWPCQEATIELWDGRAEDGDMVSVLFNGVVVMEKVVITQQKKSVVVQLREKINLIKIIAEHEGNQSPCTVDVVIRCDDRKHSLQTVLNKSENALIKLYN